MPQGCERGHGPTNQQLEGDTARSGVEVGLDSSVTLRHQQKHRDHERCCDPPHEILPTLITEFPVRPAVIGSRAAEPLQSCDQIVIQRLHVVK